MRSTRPALTQEQQHMVRRLRGEGMTWQKAARAVGCSFTSAWFIGAGPGRSTFSTRFLDPTARKLDHCRP